VIPWTPAPELAGLVLLVAALAAVAGWACCVAFRVEPLEEERDDLLDELDAAVEDNAYLVGQLLTLRAQSAQRGATALSLAERERVVRESRRALRALPGAGR
jgi:predicted Zn-dependent peptidase